jgi:hypothetical protein
LGEEAKLRELAKSSGIRRVEKLLKTLWEEEGIVERTRPREMPGIKRILIKRMVLSTESVQKRADDLLPGLRNSI